ncbi:MAG: hypothetical protein WDM76_08845 [Limisphaerales bacterium]
MCGLRQTCYSAEGTDGDGAHRIERSAAGRTELDVAALRANILTVNANGQKFREFTRRAMAGGVQGYIAFLRASG